MGTIPTLETERLVLRPFCQGDAAEVSRFAGDRSVAATTSNIPHPYDEGMACEWIAEHQPMFEKDGGVVFAITLKADGSLVGAVGLSSMAKAHQAELGYWIGKPYWGLGYCTEAARGCGGAAVATAQGCSDSGAGGRYPKALCGRIVL